MSPSSPQQRDDRACPRVVIDTNALLDWLVFRDPATDALRSAIEHGLLCWIATAPMRDELAHVLSSGLAQRKPFDEAVLWASWQRWCCSVAPAPPLPAAQRLFCSDPDDQMFVDLALHAGARWLVSRDRALLKLARRARLQGVAIVTPAQWLPLPA